MLDTAVWGSGETEQGRFKANKAIASASIEQVSGGLIIHWGGGFVESIAGTTYIIEEIRNGCTRWRFQERAVSLSTGQEVIPWRSGDVISEIKPVFQCEYLDCGGKVSRSFFSSVGVKQAYVTVCGKQTYNSPWFCDIGTKEYFEATRLVVYGDHYNIEYRNISKETLSGGAIIGYRVVSDVESRVKMQSSAPSVSLSESGCKIVIIHEDTQVIEIPLDSCPDWARLLDSQSCPAGSCECIHKGHKCCYDSNTGELIKVIPL